jgi:PPOX class probable F420-dependent enzyme
LNSEKKNQRPSDASDALGAIRDAKYLNLESYRRNGTGIRTPVWFAAGSSAFPGSDNQKLYVYTTAGSGKAKRIRRSGSIKIAACDMRGKVTGPWTDALAKVVTGEEFDLGMRLLDRKYFPWKQLLNFSAILFRRQERIVLAISPVATSASAGEEP